MFYVQAALAGTDPLPVAGKLSGKATLQEQLQEEPSLEEFIAQPAQVSAAGQPELSNGTRS